MAVSRRPSRGMFPRQSFEQYLKFERYLAVFKEDICQI